MQKSTDTLAVAPGIALQTLLRNSKESSLRDLIGPSIVDTVRGFAPDLVSDSRLGELAARLIEPSRALHDAKMRERIIRMLPLPKARRAWATSGCERRTYAVRQSLFDSGRQRGAGSPLFFFGVVRDPRAPADTSPDTMKVPAGYALFDHQRAAAECVIDALADTPHKVVLHMPTGSGKTRTAMHIVATHLRQYEPTVVCWLAQNAELLDQAADEFEKAWRYLGNRETGLVRFWGHRKPDVLDTRDGVIVAGLSKMSALDNRDPATLLRLADRVSLTIIDEAHQAVAPTYAAILTALYSKRPHNALLGLTATPGEAGRISPKTASCRTISMAERLHSKSRATRILSPS